MNFHGLEIADTTIEDIRVNMSRTKEIQTYLDEHPYITNYVILDDDIINEPLSTHWVQCSFKNGLTKKLAEEAIQILKEKHG